jgi:hypothetical protein
LELLTAENVKFGAVMKPPSAVAFPSAREMPSTLYFWWLVYLRSSLDYWWICHEKGKCNDPRLVKVWKDFGNLFQYNSALDWWNDRGAGVFDNPQKEIDLLTPLGSGIQVLRDEDLVAPQPGMLCLAVPFPMDLDQVNAYFLETWKNALLLGNFSPKSAKYQIKKFDGKSKKTIITAFQAIALERCKLQTADGEKINHWGCYEMGSFLKLGSQRKRPEKSQDSPKAAVKKQKSIRSLFCQNKESAAKYISNVEIGIFPSTKEVEMIPRWSSSQQSRLDQAKINGSWQSSGWLGKELDFMLPNTLLVVPINESESEAVLSKITAFGDICI